MILGSDVGSCDNNSDVGSFVVVGDGSIEEAGCKEIDGSKVIVGLNVGLKDKVGLKDSVGCTDCVGSTVTDELGCAV